jgi:hypothetical protein
MVFSFYATIVLTFLCHFSDTGFFLFRALKMNGDIQLMTALVQNVSVNASTVNEKFCKIRHTVKRCCTPFGMTTVFFYRDKTICQSDSQRIPLVRHFFYL